VIINDPQARSLMETCQGLRPSLQLATTRQLNTLATRQLIISRQQLIICKIRGRRSLSWCQSWPCRWKIRNRRLLTNRLKMATRIWSSPWFQLVAFHSRRSTRLQTWRISVGDLIPNVSVPPTPPSSTRPHREPKPRIISHKIQYWNSNLQKAKNLTYLVVIRRLPVKRSLSWYLALRQGKIARVKSLW